MQRPETKLLVRIPPLLTHYAPSVTTADKGAGDGWSAGGKRLRGDDDVVVVVVRPRVEAAAAGDEDQSGRALPREDRGRESRLANLLTPGYGIPKDGAGRVDDLNLVSERHVEQRSERA